MDGGDHGTPGAACEPHLQWHHAPAVEDIPALAVATIEALAAALALMLLLPVLPLLPLSGADGNLVSIVRRSMTSRLSEKNEGS